MAPQAAGDGKQPKGDRARLQRLRVTFARGEEVKYITHLDLMRLWERTLRRSDVGLAYSEGFSPHPRLSLAAPLPVGVTGDGELMDVFLSRPMGAAEFLGRVRAAMPPGMTAVSVEEVGTGLPSLQSEVRWAEYEVEGRLGDAPAGVDGAVARFLAAATVPWEHRREEKVRRYDIRALVRELTVEPAEAGRYRLRMRLQCDNTATGRPEQVAAALGLPEPERIHRRRLGLAGTSPTREAWRRAGRFVE